MKISIPDLYQKYTECSSVSTDTRKIEANALFFALKGPNFDANAFAAEALNKGARYAVIDDPQYQTDERLLLVDDALKALQDLANHHRHQLRIPVIGLGGSNGKTTTKELLNAVLSTRYRVYATKGNLNNHIGVPLTLLAIDQAVEIAVLELGANRIGDLAELVAIAEPTYGYLTNIGKEHLEGFGSLEGVIEGEGELFDYLAAAGGTVIFNEADEVVARMVQRRRWAYQYSFGANATLLDETPFVRYADRLGQVHVTHLMGAYNFDNIRAALAIGHLFGVDEAAAHAAVCGYVSSNNRSQIIQHGTTTILMDAYNANPSSMAEALRMFERWQAERKMIILGDMFELGETAPAEHAALGKLIAECHFDYVLLVGELMQHALPHLPKAYYFPDKFGLHVWLQDHPMPHMHVLVKGSRGMGLESVLKAMPA